jgi:hypothetical protein
MKIQTTVERLLVNRALLVQRAQRMTANPERQMRLLEAAGAVRSRLEILTRRAA